MCRSYSPIIISRNTDGDATPNIALEEPGASNKVSTSKEPNHEVGTAAKEAQTSGEAKANGTAGEKNGKVKSSGKAKAKASNNEETTVKTKKGKANQAKTSVIPFIFSDEAEELDGPSSGSGKGMDDPKLNSEADHENAEIDSGLAGFFHPNADVNDGRQEYYVKVRKLHRKYN
jgi:hypothetical protein